MAVDMEQVKAALTPEEPDYPKSAQQLGADALPLPVVLNDDGHLRRRLVDRAETRKGHHPGATGGLIFSDDRETSAIVHARETAHERIGQSRDRRQEPQVPCTWAQALVKQANRPLFMTV